MKAVQKIDERINDLREVRRMVVKGEKSFSKEKEMDKADEFMTTLSEYGIPFETFTFGARFFVKISEVEEEPNVNVGEEGIKGLTGIEE